ncbi:hypothetical protein GDO81_019456, partial [Engystomops pustulosus]
IRSQLVEQFKCLEQQSESRLALLQDLQEFFRRKAEIELEYSRSLEKLAERFSSKVRSAREQHHFKKDQHLLSPVNCWYLVLSQTRRESKDHATLNDIFLNNVIVRLSHISEDVIRLFKKSKDIGLQMHEELAKVTNELYTVSALRGSLRNPMSTMSYCGSNPPHSLSAGDEDVSHVPRRKHQCREQAEGRREAGGEAVQQICRARAQRPAPRRQTAEAQLCQKDRKDEGEETSEILRKQAEVYKGQKRISAEPGGHQRMYQQVLHPRRVRSHR